jgi:AcrR family transcriptional regulator
MGRELASRQNPKRKELEEALIVAATCKAAEQGYGSVRARDLAAQVGCSVGAIYTIFNDLDSLLLVVKARALDTIGVKVIAVLAHSRAQTRPEGEAQLIALARAFVEYACQNPRLWSGVFDHVELGGASMNPLRLRLEGFITAIEQPLAVVLPFTPQPQRRSVARALFASVQGMATFGLDPNYAPVSTQELLWQVHMVAAAALRGLRDDHPALTPTNSL